MTTNKLHLLNEQTVIRGIALEEIDAFSDIPEHLITENVLRHWIMCGSIDEIPLERLTDELREMSVSSNPENIRFFSSSNCSNYTALLMKAMSSNYFDFDHAEMDQITPAVLAFAYRKNGDCLRDFFRTKVWASDKEKTDFVDELVLKDTWLLTSPSIRMSDVSDSALAKGLSATNDADYYLRRIFKAGRYNVFNLIANQDRWPGMKKPHDLMSAIWRVMKVDRNNAEFFILSAFIKQYPIEEVCQFMGRGQARQRLLVDIFPSEEILPHIEHMPHAKRQLLSTDMEI